MKARVAVLVLSLFTPLALAQSGGMKGMDMKDMPMKGMDMKGMDMKGMEKKDAKGTVHRGTGVVTRVERDKVTIRHEPIASLNWPTMTMAFAVKNEALMKKLAKDKKVDFEFVQQGNEFVVTAVK